jgi:hypothetical protein
VRPVTRRENLSAAIDRLAAAVPSGALMAATDPAALLDAATEMIRSGQPSGNPGELRSDVAELLAEIDHAIAFMRSRCADQDANALATSRATAEGMVRALSDLARDLEREHGRRDHAGRASECATCDVIRRARRWTA